MQLYLVGRWLDPDGVLWGVQGIFSQTWKADEACRDDSCFVIPFELDKEAETLEKELVSPRIPTLEDPFASVVIEKEPL